MIAPVRILLITTHYHPVVGGVETHARDVAGGLRRRGHRVTVLTTRLTSGWRSEICRVGGVPVVRTPPGSGRKRFTKWLFVPVAAAAAVRLARHTDVIFCPDLRGVGIAAIVAGWWAGRPVVLQGATPGAFSASHWDASFRRWPVRPPGALVRLAKRLLYAVHRRAAAVTCITREHAEEARASGLAEGRIHYVPHGVDVGRFHPLDAETRDGVRRAHGWGDAVVVLYVGRLSREKGVLELLEAWRQVAVPGARLVVAGPDVTGHELDAGPAARAFVKSHGLDQSVSFLGSVDEPAPLMAASDVLVLPSHYEAFPLTTIEAMACGVPVVASFVGGLRDYLVDGVNALTCPPADPEALARALTRVLTDGELRARLGARARETVLADFDRERNLDRYERVFAAARAEAGV